jgi:hypothetical protein
MASSSGELSVLQLLCKHQSDRVTKNHEIIGLACLYRHADCVKLLERYINKDDFKDTTTGEYLDQIQSK